MPKGEYLQYGGQAVVEGVMMRSPKFFSVACRAPNGQILVQTEAIEKTWIGKMKWLKYPFLRGSLALIDSMALGSRALRFASNVQLDPAYEIEPDPIDPASLPDKSRVMRTKKVVSAVNWLLTLVFLSAVGVAITAKRSHPTAQNSNIVGQYFIASLVIAAFAAVLTWVVEKSVAGKVRSEYDLLARYELQETRKQDRETGQEAPPAMAPHIQSGAIGLTLLISFFIGMGIFVYLPNLIAEWSQRRQGQTNGMRINLISEIVKILIFFGYIGFLGSLKDIREIFKYHGAEHKAINTLEADQPLELSYCLKQTRLHPRCGTSFAIIVLILGLITFTFVPRYPVTGHQGRMFVDLTVRVLLEILILPIIAGIAYELLRIAGKFRNQGLINFFFKPGIWSQFLTTREPDPPQIEVALEALKAVMRAETSGKVEGEQPLVLEGSHVVAA